MLFNMFICSKQRRIQNTQTTSIVVILNIFNLWRMRIKGMHLCILCITNWNMKHLILELSSPRTFGRYNCLQNSFSLVTKSVLIQLSTITNHFLFCSLTFKLKKIDFHFDSDYFPLVIFLKRFIFFFSFIYFGFALDGFSTNTTTYISILKFCKNNPYSRPEF